MKRLYSLLLWLLIPLAVLAEYSVPLVEDYSSNKTIEATVNGIKVLFAFDTGSTSLLLNRNIFDELVKKGQIKEADLSTEKEAEMANGETHLVRSFTVKRLQVGECVLRNIQASVGVNDQPDATPLFGQTVLERFSSYTVKNNRFYFQPKSDEEQDALCIAHRLRKDTTRVNNQKIVDALKPFVKHLSPRYMIIYADALSNTNAYEQAIRIYRQLLESDSFIDDDNTIRVHIINAEVGLAEDLYDKKSYEACEQLLKQIIEESKKPVYDYGVQYGYYSLCFVYLQQKDYKKAEKTIKEFEGYTTLPDARLAQLYQYMHQYYTSIDDDTNAQKYKKLSEQAE